MKAQTANQSKVPLSLSPNPAPGEALRNLATPSQAEQPLRPTCPEHTFGRVPVFMPAVKPLPSQPSIRQIQEHERMAEQITTQVLGAAESRASFPASVSEITPTLQTRLTQSQGGGETLPEPTRRFFEQRFGHDFSRVRIHTDETADQLAHDLRARAFTYGNHIYFAARRYQPEVSAGRQLLAHELAHVASTSPTGPAVPLRQGEEPSENKPVDHAEELRKLIPTPKSFLKYLKPSKGEDPQIRLEAAWRVLLETLESTATSKEGLAAAKLLDDLLKKQQKLIAEVQISDAEAVIDKVTEPLRTTLTSDTEAMLAQYQQAAYLKAVEQWTAKKLKGKVKKKKTVDPEVGFLTTLQARVKEYPNVA